MKIILAFALTLSFATAFAGDVSSGGSRIHPLGASIFVTREAVFSEKAIASIYQAGIKLNDFIVNIRTKKSTLVKIYFNSGACLDSHVKWITPNPDISVSKPVFDRMTPCN